MQNASIDCRKADDQQEYNQGDRGINEKGIE
jgi:hypothetical protein